MPTKDYIVEIYNLHTRESKILTNNMSGYNAAREGARIIAVHIYDGLQKIVIHVVPERTE